MKTCLRILVISISLGSIAHADLANLGTLSYDTFIPSGGGFVGIDAFNIANLTGGFNLPPDFPVLDGLTFQSATLTLSDGEVFTLGNIAPGFLLDGNGNPIVQVPDEEMFQSAEFTATLSAATFAVPSGTFSASSGSIDIFLLPSQGPNLTPDVNATLITVSGQSLVTTPEPDGLPPLCVLVAWLAHRVYARRRARSVAKERL